MARSRVRLNSPGIAAVLKSPGMHKAVRDAAEAVAQNVRDMDIAVEGVPGDVDLPVTVQMVTTDRAHANVTIAHPSGEAVQAKHGSLTKAAAQAGLQVRGKS